MGKLGRVSALCALCAAFACGDKGGGSSGAAAEGRAALERVAVDELAKPVDPRFDADGRLKSSGRRVLWLEVPMGFEELPGSSERAAVFEARDMPYEVVRSYLDERLAPQKIELGRQSMHFLRATPSHTQLISEPLNVSVRESDAATRTVRLQVDALTQRAERPISVESAKELLARDRQRIQ